MGTKFGVSGQLFYQTAGVSGGGGWVENNNVRDLNIGMTKDEIDDTTREGGGWKSTKAKLKDVEVTWQMRADDLNVHYGVFRDAWINDTHLGLRIYDGADNGPEADFVITGFSQAQELAGAQMVDVTAKITYVDTVPVWNEAP